MSTEKKRRQLLEALTDEQLGRMTDITPENYNWSNFYPDGHSKKPGRCVAGHAFDLSLADRTFDKLAEEDKAFARELSTAFCFTGVKTIQEMARREVERRQREPVSV